MVIAFFAPPTRDDVSHSGEQALADFQYSAKAVGKPLKGLGIELRVAYSRSFQIRTANKARRFSAAKTTVGYYFVAPGMLPRIAYGLMTDDDLLLTRISISEVEFRNHEFK